MKIIVTKRSEDCRAWLENQPGKLEAGQTVMEAVYKLIVSHGGEFGIEMEVRGSHER